MIKDPVCGMTINQQANVITAQYQGKTYYFCSQMCKMMFEREPAKYIKTEDEQEKAQ
jgi:YHS domain-containing protein